MPVAEVVAPPQAVRRLPIVARWASFQSPDKATSSPRRIPATQKTQTTSPVSRGRIPALPRARERRLLPVAHLDSKFPPELPINNELRGGDIDARARRCRRETQE